MVYSDIVLRLENAHGADSPLAMELEYRLWLTNMGIIQNVSRRILHFTKYSRSWF